MKRGDIFYIRQHNPEGTGSEIYQEGRPAIIVSNNVCNDASSGRKRRLVNDPRALSSTDSRRYIILDETLNRIMRTNLLYFYRKAWGLGKYLFTRRNGSYRQGSLRRARYRNVTRERGRPYA